MKRTFLSALVILGLAPLALSQNYGANMKGSQGTYTGAEYNLPWDSSKTMEIEGEFYWFDTLTPQEGGVGEQRMWLKTDTGPVCVSLGPSDFIKTTDIKISPHAKVWVIGSMVSNPGMASRWYQTNEVLLARQVRTSTRTWDLRSERGTPFWPTTSMESQRTMGRETTYGTRPGDTKDYSRYNDDVWKLDSNYNRAFKADMLDTWTGEIVSINSYDMPNSKNPAIVAMVKVGADTFPVHLAPAWFIERQQYQLKPGDTIMFTGSKTMWDDKDIIMATEVRRGSTVWIFRDKDGRPVWIKL